MRKSKTVIVIISLLFLQATCPPPPPETDEKSEEAYEADGKYWGERLRERPLASGETSQEFVDFLVSGRRPGVSAKEDWATSNYYFTVHTSLKQAFHKGFRKGYQEREADLILGPHIEKAAGKIGERNARFFGNDTKTYVADQKDYQNRFKESLRNSVAIFMELIAEGSPADREKFKNSFLRTYKIKLEQFLQSHKCGNNFIAILFIMSG